MTELSPPSAFKLMKKNNYHGLEKIDNYDWLRSDKWQEVMRNPKLLEPEIKKYLDAENAYTETVLAPLKDDIENLYKEMKLRVKEKDSTVPMPDGIWAYYRRFRHGGEHTLYCRCPRKGGEEQLLFDGDLAARGFNYFKVGVFSHSPDHSLAAYAIDTNGSEIFSIRFRDLSSGEDLPDIIENTNGGLVWAADSRTIFYTVLDDNHRPHAVRRYRLGGVPKDAEWVYVEQDPGFFVGVSNIESRRFIVISAYDHQTSESYIISSDTPHMDPQLVAPRITGTEYHLSDQEERFLIRTNAGHAEDFKIVSAPLAQPGPENWNDVVSHAPDRLILYLTTFKDYWVRVERIEALPRIIVTDSKGCEYSIAFNEDVYAITLDGSLEFETKNLRFNYSSMTTPEQVFDYDMATRERELLKTQEVPSGHDPKDYVTQRLFFPAQDGELIPVSILYRKDTHLDGTAPVLLYGYGAYGMSIPASFNISRLSLVDRGFIYAIAHIRGGMDKGYRWYKFGRMNYKTNTFNDFIDVADGFVAKGMVAPGRIAAHGGSAGGMLMGVVSNRRPDLFSVILAEVPFVDVLNTMLDNTLPLTPPEWPEWGNPINSLEAYEYIRSYSPYDNVEAKNYPSIFATAGLTDPRVTYWEPAKWVAKLREMKKDENTICLKTNMDAGHGGASGRFHRLKETAELYAFLLSAS